MIPLSSTRKLTKKTSFKHIICVHPAIKFTVEDNKENGSIPFLDTIVKPEVDGGLSITVYRKPTQQYLQWDSHHNLSSKFSVINTSPIGPKLCAAILSCSNKKRNTSEKLSPKANILNGLLTSWRKDSTGHPVRPLMGLTTRVPQVPLLPLEKVRVRGHIVIPYTQGLCESIKKICGRYGTPFKGGSTIKNL